MGQDSGGCSFPWSTGYRRACYCRRRRPRRPRRRDQRVAVIEKIKPAVVAIFAKGGQGGGSGVLISDDGYALTNFHVVSGSGPVMECGLPDGVLYHAVLVGLNKVGDVALIKLLPDKEGKKFPVAKMGDSDAPRAGDWSLALGNPFLLATDFTPTVTFGLVSGIHRYQYPSGTLLEYTDCIQVDTSINPGNSGGPLFNMDGELIGINGRGSFEKRGRVNSGVGYAISINQIKNFLGHLRAGLDTDHASLGATVVERAEEGVNPQLVVNRIISDCDARRRGLDLDDELVGFAGRPMTSVNQFKNVLGLYPKDWRVPLVYRRETVKEDKRETTKKEILVRLMGVQEQEILDPAKPRLPDQPPGPGGKPAPRPQPLPKSPATKLYEAKPGYANYYFNKLERNRLLAAFRKHGDFSALTGPWTIDAEGELGKRNTTVKIVIGDEKDKDGKNARTVVKATIGDVEWKLEPLKDKQDLNVLKDPPGSGGLMLALYHYRQLLTIGEKSFEGGFSHGGQEPFYPLPPDGQKPDYNKLRVDTEVLRTEHSGVAGKWYFALPDQKLLGFEITPDHDDDPCEVFFSDYKNVDGRLLPHKIEVRYRNDCYAALTVKSYNLAGAK